MPLTVTAEMPKRDDCQILTRLKAFVVNQGVVATLQHVFRDAKGRPVNLEALLAGSDSTSDTADDAVVKLRVKEFLGYELNTCKNPIYELDGEVITASTGTIKATLTSDIVENAGLYELSWAIVDPAGNPVAIDRGLLSVERSLWPADLVKTYRNLGPPTLQEIRMRLVDSAAADNVLLDAVEFSDDQIMHALAEPVRTWNETPPPIKKFTTRTFPFRGAWIEGVLAQLHLLAGNTYRRNRLAHSAGGTAIDDLNKEREYMAEGNRLWEKYFTWLRGKKIEINLKHFSGQIVSEYSGITGW